MTKHNVLQIEQSGKGIPYGGTGEIRPDGYANHGFKNLKGALQRLEDIPELQRDAELRHLVAAINGPETGLLSIGCLSAPVDDERGPPRERLHRVRLQLGRTDR